MSALTITRDTAASLAGRARGGERSPASIVFLIALWFSLLIAFFVLVTLIVTTVLNGMDRLDGGLVTEYTSATPAKAGARAAILGSIWVIGVTAVLSIPLGVAAAIHLEEFANKRPLVQPIHRAQHPEPRGRTRDHLRHARARRARRSPGSRTRTSCSVALSRSGC